MSASASGEAVCSGGDNYHAHFQTTRFRFSSLSRHVVRNLYWIDATQIDLVPGHHTFSVLLVLVDTQRRGLQQREGRGPLQFALTADGIDESPLIDHLRDWQCAWAPVRIGNGAMTFSTEGSGFASTSDHAHAPRCKLGSAATEGAVFLTIGENDTCDGLWCSSRGDRPWQRLLNSSTPLRLQQRRSRLVPSDGARHLFAPLLRPLRCAYHLVDEDEIATCLRGVRLLNIGSSIAADLAKACLCTRA